jgi:hypothetical protein
MSSLSPTSSALGLVRVAPHWRIQAVVTVDGEGTGGDVRLLGASHGCGDEQAVC